MANINMRLDNLVSEMAFALRERMGAGYKRWGKDAAVFVATAEGSIAAIDNKIHFGSASEMVLSLLGPHGIPIEQGDVIVSNDPYLGSSHVQDFYILTPVYHQAKAILFVGAKAHLPDVGGDVEGGFNPRAEEIWAEGVRFTPLRVSREGRTDTCVLNMILLNSRTPDRLRRGLESMIAAVELGKKGVQSILEASGDQSLLEELDATVTDTENRLRETASQWSSGEYAGSCPVQNESIKAKELKVESKLKIGDGQIEIDLSANALQLRAPYNSPRGNTLSFALMPFLSLLPSGVAINAGIWKVIRVQSNKGTIVDPVLPAPTAFSPFHVGREIAASVRSAMEKFLSREEKERLDRGLASLVNWHPQADQ
jgi:N-methylhydantoinase B